MLNCSRLRLTVSVDNAMHQAQHSFLGILYKGKNHKEDSTEIISNRLAVSQSCGIHYSSENIVSRSPLNEVCLETSTLAY